MARTIITRQKSIGTSPEAGASTGFQFYRGSGRLEALVLNYGASADAGTVVTAYDGTSTSGISIYARTSGTDAGTTVPVTISGDADIVAGTATAGVSKGVIFTTGLFIDVTLDVAGPQVITAWIRPLIKKTVNVATSGSAGSATGSAGIWHGPALWCGYSVLLDPNSPSTLDMTFTDEPNPAFSGATLMTKTNYAVTPGTKVLRMVATTVGHDEAGADVTTAATGAYNQNGIYLTNGLSVNLAQADALTRAVSLECLFDA